MSVTALGYLVIETCQPEEWHDLLATTMGLHQSAANGPMKHYQLDEWQRRLSVVAGDEERIAAVGWQVPDEPALASIRHRVEQAGVAISEGTHEECGIRACSAMFSFIDPISSMPTEIFYGPTISQLPFQPSASISGYETGELGLGHVVYFIEDYAEGHRFYTEVLGFKTSDRIVWDGGEKDATFYHCNPRHHSLAIMPPFGDIPPGTFNHLMLQTKCINDVGIIYDRVRAQQLPIMMHLGKHTNDHTESFYLISPSGFGLEIGCNSRTITPDWDVKVYDAPMIWGHEQPGTYSA